MRVNQSGNNPAQISELAERVKVTHVRTHQKGERSSEASAARKAEAQGSVKSEISSKGRELAHAKALAHGAPDIREEKIAALKARIAAGTYHVDADKVADRMVDDHIKMHGIG